MSVDRATTALHRRVTLMTTVQKFVKYRRNRHEKFSSQPEAATAAAATLTETKLIREKLFLALQTLFTDLPSKGERKEPVITMGPERHRRLVLLILMCLLLVVTSWVEHHLTSSTPATLTPPPSASISKNSAKRKVEWKLEIGGGRPEDGGNIGSNKGRKADMGDIDDDDDDEMDDMEYFRALKIRAQARLISGPPTLRLDIHSCLPRFICELHALSPGATLTDFEKDVIGLFRNHVVLEGPDSPVYQYQVAAHMGLLCSGLDPSPCHSLYPSCPLSRMLLLEVLRSVKSNRRMFYSG
ncbi:hypothetical protein Pcinc_035815 [Petrolisthes cinctipes]|uniref:Uncharacterized protein n=1 Tax=Petrolisthes cinctipes TaxID=88211 RepID=A0AAE1BWW3_PETCI|nr:hypothetical protein Pcinc_035815 [Petrolisthes cinctipes]